jgi:hypothetical protein
MLFKHSPLLISLSEAVSPYLPCKILVLPDLLVFHFLPFASVEPLAISLYSQDYVTIKYLELER